MKMDGSFANFENSKKQSKAGEPERFEAHVVSRRCSKRYITFSFDRPLPSDWFWMLQHAGFPHAFMIGYEKMRIVQLEPNEIGLPVAGDESADILCTLAGYMSRWVDAVNLKYQNREH